MKIKVNPIAIPEENPFYYDKLNRKEHIEILTNFFESIEDKNFILGLNGSWGVVKPYL